MSCCPGAMPTDARQARTKINPHVTMISHFKLDLVFWGFFFTHIELDKQFFNLRYGPV